MLFSSKPRESMRSCTTLDRPIFDGSWSAASWSSLDQMYDTRGIDAAWSQRAFRLAPEIKGGTARRSIVGMTNKRKMEGGVSNITFGFRLTRLTCFDARQSLLPGPVAEAGPVESSSACLVLRDWNDGMTTDVCYTCNTIGLACRICLMPRSITH